MRSPLGPGPAWARRRDEASLLAKRTGPSLLDRGGPPRARGQQGNLHTCRLLRLCGVCAPDDEGPRPPPAPGRGMALTAGRTSRHRCVWALLPHCLAAAPTAPAGPAPAAPAPSSCILRVCRLAVRLGWGEHSLPRTLAGARSALGSKLRRMDSQLGLA